MQSRDDTEIALQQHKCAFSGTLITNQFACEHALPVARRAGPDVACQSATAHLQCEALFQCLKTAATKELLFKHGLPETQLLVDYLPRI